MVTFNSHNDFLLNHSAYRFLQSNKHKRYLSKPVNLVFTEKDKIYHRSCTASNNLYWEMRQDYKHKFKVEPEFKFYFFLNALTGERITRDECNTEYVYIHTSIDNYGFAEIEFTINYRGFKEERFAFVPKSNLAINEDNVALLVRRYLSKHFFCENSSHRAVLLYNFGDKAKTRADFLEYWRLRRTASVDDVEKAFRRKYNVSMDWQISMKQALRYVEKHGRSKKPIHLMKFNFSEVMDLVGDDDNIEGAMQEYLGQFEDNIRFI